MKRFERGDAKEEHEYRKVGTEFYSSHKVTPVNHLPEIIYAAARSIVRAAFHVSMEVFAGYFHCYDRLKVIL